MTTTDALIVGGGLMGCSGASHLARHGARVTLAERRALPGLETTARSGAIMRAQRLNRFKTSPLSRDELHKARSKLKTKPTFKSS